MKNILIDLCQVPTDLPMVIEDFITHSYGGLSTKDDLILVCAGGVEEGTVEQYFAKGDVEMIIEGFGSFCSALSYYSVEEGSGLRSVTFSNQRDDDLPFEYMFSLTGELVGAWFVVKPYNPIGVLVNMGIVTGLEDFWGRYHKCNERGKNILLTKWLPFT